MVIYRRLKPCSLEHPTLVEGRARAKFQAAVIPARVWLLDREFLEESLMWRDPVAEICLAERFHGAHHRFRLSNTDALMAGRTRKTTARTWIDIARRTLTEEGIIGVKADRLATRLGVTRGGFYNNFRDREEFLARLLEEWETSCKFLPPDPPGASPAEAVAWVDKFVERLIDEDGYDHHFDMAVREWARSDQRAAWAVERADRERLAVLTRFFEVLGYNAEEAQTRAQVLYYHQIGYYAMGVRQSAVERRRRAPIYLDILCGAEQLSAARKSRIGKKSRARSRA